MTHELKIHPECFEAVRNGDKTFHLCRADREHQVGDTLVLAEYDPKPIKYPYPGLKYSGRQIQAIVTYIQEVFIKVDFLPVRYNILAIKVEK
jgi:hypothetical protein